MVCYMEGISGLSGDSLVALHSDRGDLRPPVLLCNMLGGFLPRICKEVFIHCASMVWNKTLSLVVFITFKIYIYS